MGRFKRHLFIVLGLALAGAIGAAFSTHTAQAVVATLVQVVNPATSPVPTLAQDTARAPYQSSVDNTNVCSGSSCTFTFGNIPSGHRLFGTRISGRFAYTVLPNNFAVEINVDGQFNSAFFVQGSSTALFSVFNNPVPFVLDSPSSVSVTVTLVGNNAAFTAGSPQIVNLYGEEVDCSAAVSCQPIVTTH